MLKNILISSMAILLIGGCAAIDNPQLDTALSTSKNSTSDITCDNGCKNEWERAQAWVMKHSKMKIQLVNDMMITTYNPIRNDPDYGFNITKEPLGNNRYKITMDLGNANMFGGKPKPLEVKSLFNYYVQYGKDLLDNVPDKTWLSVR